MNGIVYLMIETQSFSEGPGAGDFINTALDLARSGGVVSLWLLQNGVLNLLDTNLSFQTMISETPGFTLYTDDFSLVQRSIRSELVVSSGAQVADMAQLSAQLMRPQCKVIWH